MNSSTGSNAPGSLIWDSGDCSGFSATPIIPNNSNSPRVCGLMTSNAIALRRCCPGVETYTCWQYCATDQTFNDLSDCLYEGTENEQPPSSLFCQSNSTGTIHKDKVSAGLPRIRAPGLGSLLLLVVAVAYLLAPVSARIIPSLDERSQLERRKSDSCQFIEERHYVQLGESREVAQGMTGAPFVIAEIDTGIGNNNRTINGTSAAGSSYDAFFDVLSQQFGRQFPAMSSIELVYEFPCAEGQLMSAAFTPFHWCVEGTATGCSGLASRDNVPVKACGPVFVEDNNSTSPQTLEQMKGAMIQGTLSAVSSS